MRLMVTIITLSVIILGLGFWSNYSLQASSDELTKQINIISTDIKNGKWQAAKNHNEELQRTWDKKAKWWPVFLDHQEMDNIEFSLARVQEYVASNNKSLSLGQLSELKLMVKHIPEKEALNIENIL
ncbi:DUF4363 family protein [Syntrophomonas palmitatica]|uniref:DUF4363 family protein n=1 Tax=Syntrophomonas palmitatica TaxID=402877 RepID=UPI0006CF6EF9|nr:DUF4363 family protein [Syntrophomonas palmitatica]